MKDVWLWILHRLMENEVGAGYLLILPGPSSIWGGPPKAAGNSAKNRLLNRYLTILMTFRGAAPSMRTPATFLLTSEPVTTNFLTGPPRYARTWIRSQSPSARTISDMAKHIFSRSAALRADIHCRECPQSCLRSRHVCVQCRGMYTWNQHSEPTWNPPIFAVHPELLHVRRTARGEAQHMNRLHWQPNGACRHDLICGCCAHGGRG